MFRGIVFSMRPFQPPTQALLPRSPRAQNNRRARATRWRAGESGQDHLPAYISTERHVSGAAPIHAIVHDEITIGVVLVLALVGCEADFVWVT